MTSLLKTIAIVMIPGLLLFAAGPALACPVLEQASPRVGHTVSGPIPEVSLRFSGAVIPDSSTLEVDNEQGVAVSTGKPYGDKNDETVIAVKIKNPHLPPGKYKVLWKVMCDCGDGEHSIMPSSYKFTVDPASGRTD